MTTLANYDVPFAVEIVLSGNHESDPRKTVFHYRQGAGNPTPTDAQLAALANQAANVVLPRLLACCTNTITWTDVSARDISSANGHIYSTPLTQPVTGTRPGETLPGADNVCLIKHQTLHRRGANGRLFVPELSENDQSNGFIQAALQALLIALAQALLTRLTDSAGVQWAPIVASKTHHDFGSLTSVSFDTNIDHLITRERGKRRHRRRPITTA